MKINREFVCEKHEDFGGLGWRPAWIPNFDPLSAVAHDVIEHLPSDRGDGLYQECRAQGAMVFLRWENGYCNDFGRAFSAEDLASDIHYFWPGIRHIETPPRSYRLAEHVECLLVEFKQAVRKMFRDNETEDCPSATDLDRMVGWMRIGYRAAKRRYRNVDAYTVGIYLFKEIDKQAERCLAGAGEGMHMRLRVDLKLGSVKAYTYYPGEEE